MTFVSGGERKYGKTLSHTVYFAYTCFNTEYESCEGTEEEPFVFLVPSDTGNERLITEYERQCPSCGLVCEEVGFGAG